MASTLTTFDFAMKEYYTDQKVEDLIYSERPFMAMLTKNEDFQGDVMPVPVLHVRPQGLAADSLATAQNNATNVVGKKFNVTVGDYQGSVSIGDKVILASRGNPGAFLQNKTAEIDGIYEQMSDNMATYLWGNGGGALGRRASASTNVITLSNPEDAINYEVGQTVVASSGDGSDGGHSLRSGSTTVASVDRAAGTVTLTSAAAITSFADDDYLFRQGDFNGDTSTVIVNGVQAFVDGTNSPGALYGMTRTADPIRLAGCYVASSDLTGLNMEERLQKLGALMTGRYKSKGADTGFMHPEDFQDLSNALQTRGTTPMKDDSTKFGFMHINYISGGKNIKIYCDPYAPKGTFFALNMKNWTLWSMLKLLHPINGDGLTMLRKATTNDYEYRLQSYPALVCNAPVNQGRVPLS